MFFVVCRELPRRPSNHRSSDVPCSRRGQEPAMIVEEANDASLLLRRGELAARGAAPGRWRASRAGRGAFLRARTSELFSFGAEGADAPPAAEAAWVTATARHRQTSRAFSINLPRSNGAVRSAAQGRPLLSRDWKTVAERRTTNARFSLRSSKKSVTSVRGTDNSERLPRRGKWLRGRDSNPNFLVQSQASCR